MNFSMMVMNVLSMFSFLQQMKNATISKFYHYMSYVSNRVCKWDKRASSYLRSTQLKLDQYFDSNSRSTRDTKNSKEILVIDSKLIKKKLENTIKTLNHLFN